MIQYGMRAHDFSGPKPLTEFLDGLAAGGIRHIQLAFEKCFSDYDFSTGHYSEGFAGYIGGELDRRGLRADVLGCYINPVCPTEKLRRREVARFVERLRYAKHIRAGMVGTETGRYDDAMAVTPLTQSRECWLTLLRSFAAIAEAAEALGVTVGVEAVFNHTVSSPERMAQFLRELRSPAVEVILDAANLVFPGESRAAQDEAVERAFDLFGGSISVLHLKDCVFENGVQRCVPPGEGVVSFGALLRRVAREKPGITGLLEESSPARFAADCAFFDSETEKAAGR